MSFGIYILGYSILITGLCYGASLMHVPSQWIGVGAIVLTGVGVISAVTATRQKDQA